ncbi:hypothetical protein [Streptomyces lavendulae]|uniref:hypothetical protein n=1 Tax=Streptomyces lavendulae TaxID=1914 RepID=UPI0031ED9E7D
MSTPDSPMLGPRCGLCGGPAVVQWQRRLTETEFADYLSLIQDRRDNQLLLADPDQPPPDLGPLPDPSDCTRSVYACAQHAITLDAAARVHTQTCTAPAESDLPGCNCAPEPVAVPDPEPERPQLPASWITEEA